MKETTLAWKDYADSQEFKTKELFDEDLRASSRIRIIKNSTSVTLYSFSLYPESAYLVVIGSLEEAISSLPDLNGLNVFIKLNLQNVDAVLLKKVYDSYDINYGPRKKKPAQNVKQTKPLENLDNVLDLYIRNHSYHINIDRTLLAGVLESYSLRQLSGEGYVIYLEDLGNGYETSFFETDGSLKGVGNLIKELEGLGDFEMEVDSTLKEFQNLLRAFNDCAAYSCSLYRIMS